jgi:hypothetical protein
MILSLFLPVFLEAQTIKGVSINLVKVNPEMGYIVLKITNKTSSMIILKDDRDIVLAIDKSRRQTFGSFSASADYLRELGLSNYYYGGTLRPGETKKVFVFFDLRANFELEKMKTIIYHINGIKFRIS